MSWSQQKSAAARSRLAEEQAGKKMVFNPLEKVFPRKLTDPGKALVISDPANLMSRGTAAFSRETEGPRVFRLPAPGQVVPAPVAQRERQAQQLDAERQGHLAGEVHVQTGPGHASQRKACDAVSD